MQEIVTGKETKGKRRRERNTGVRHRKRDEGKETEIET
jgi:hypothetical protein